MKKITYPMFICFLGFLLFFQKAISQINAGPDQYINCGECATLTGFFPQYSYNNDNYFIASIPYSPVCPYDSGSLIDINFDDRWSQVIQLPFSFKFFDTQYSQIVIGSNGVISFNVLYANNFCPWSFSDLCPSPNLPLNSIFAPYHDIDISISGTIKIATKGTAPYRKFIINFNDIALFSALCNNLKSTSQIVLYETLNIIEIYIKNKPLCSSWNSGNAIIGIQNKTGTIGYCPPGRNTSLWTANHEAWRFYGCELQYNNISWQDENGLIISTDSSVTVCPNHTSSYFLSADCGCYGIYTTQSDIVTVHILNPVANLGNDTVLCSVNPIVLNPNSGLGCSYLWNDMTTDSILTVYQPGIYSVTVTDTNLCYSVDSITVHDGIPFLPDSIHGPSYVCTDNSVSYSVSPDPETISYSWNYSGYGAIIDDSTNANINIYFNSNATNGILTVKSYGLCGESSNILELPITITTNLIGGTVSSSITDTTCPGASATLTLSNYIGQIQWQKSFNNILWNDIPNAIHPSYTTPPIFTTTYYRAALSGGCPTVYSNSVQIPVLSSIQNQNICYVTYDPDNQKNKIVWNSSYFPMQIDQVLIFTEVSLNEWELIGTVPANANQFIHLASNPNNQSYIYKIKVKDTCNNLSLFSQHHTTITLLLSFDPLSNTYGLTWSPYIGLNVSNYNIYGITSSGNVLMLGSVPGNQYFYNIINPSPMFVKYFVGFPAPSCGNKPNDTIMSNYVNSYYASVDENYKNKFLIVPNPTYDYFTILHNENMPFHVKVFDVKGELLISKEIDNAPIDIKTLTKGIYIVNINNFIYKLVKL